jgi:hypothetical protein
MAVLGAIYFRIEDGDMDYGNPLVPDAHPVNLRWFRVIKVTRCGAWVIEIFMEHGQEVNWFHSDRKRFVLDGQGKRLCYPNLISARNSYLRRKECHIARLTATLALAKQGQAAAQQNDFIAYIRRDFRCEDPISSTATPNLPPRN